MRDIHHYARNKVKSVNEQRRQSRHQAGILQQSCNSGAPTSDNSEVTRTRTRTSIARISPSRQKTIQNENGKKNESDGAKLGERGGKKNRGRTGEHDRDNNRLKEEKKLTARKDETDGTHFGQDHQNENDRKNNVTERCWCHAVICRKDRTRESQSQTFSEPKTTKDSKSSPSSHSPERSEVVEWNHSKTRRQKHSYSTKSNQQKSPKHWIKFGRVRQHSRKNHSKNDSQYHSKHRPYSDPSIQSLVRNRYKR